MPLEELARPDERVMLMTMRPVDMSDSAHAESAARRVQHMISGADLIPDVPEHTRRNFERLRMMHAYGVLYYDLFTVVADHALFVLEQALGERFIAFYDGEIPLVHRDLGVDVLKARNLASAYAALNRGGQFAKGWKLQPRSGGAPLSFRATMSDLFRWARREGLLHGQRNRHLENLTVRMRNHVAHPTGYHLTWEVDSAREIWDLADTINHLWGGTTPGGRLYSRPVVREILAIAWDDKEGQTMGRTETLAYWPEAFRHSVILVRGNFDDQSLLEFDSRFDTTSFPTDLLWGPGTAERAVEWLAQEQPAGDQVNVLDRLFALRVLDGRADLPRRLDVAAGLEGSDRLGNWCLVRADFPNEAFAHVRNAQLAQSQCHTLGPCPVCAAETVAHGSLEEVIAAAETVTGQPVAAVHPRFVQVPSMWRALPTSS